MFQCQIVVTCFTAKCRNLSVKTGNWKHGPWLNCTGRTLTRLYFCRCSSNCSVSQKVAPSPPKKNFLQHFLSLDFFCLLHLAHNTSSLRLGYGIMRACGSADWTTCKMRIRMWMKIRILPTGARSVLSINTIVRHCVLDRMWSVLTH